MNVSIIGTGRMARAITTLLLKGDNRISVVGHTPGHADSFVKDFESKGGANMVSLAADGTLPGDMVIPALYYPAAESVVRQYSSQLGGKILVDITNPIEFQTMEPLFPGSSGAEQLARLAPANTKVVKAFNTTFASTLLAGRVAGTPLDVFLAGDDAGAKGILSQLIETAGLRAIDAGPLVRARQLEALGLLQIALQSLRNTGYASAIKFLP